MAVTIASLVQSVFPSGLLIYSILNRCLATNRRLLLRHIAQFSDLKVKPLDTSLLMVTRINQSHAIVVRLHERNINVVIITPETAVTVGV